MEFGVSRNVKKSRSWKFGGSKRSGHGDILSQSFVDWRKTGFPDLVTSKADYASVHMDGDPP